MLLLVHERIALIRRRPGDTFDEKKPGGTGLFCLGAMRRQPLARTSTRLIAGKATSSAMRRKSDARKGITPLAVSM